MNLNEISKKLVLDAKIKNQNISIIYDEKHKEISLSFIEESKKICEKVDIFNLDNYDRPVKKIDEEIEKSVLKTDLLIMIISKKSETNYEEYPFLKKYFFKMKKRNKNLRLGFLLDVKKNDFVEIFQYKPQDIKSLNQNLILLIEKGKQVRIKTSLGTNLIIDISNKNLKWINQNADLSKPSLQHSLLAGEVYGCPTNVNGIVIIDGVLGGDFQKYGLLENTPLKLKIYQGRIISAQCENNYLLNELKEHLNKYENADRIGEFGFGTNISLEKFYGIIGIDEKFPGNHIAFGHPYTEKTGAKWSSETHIDCVIKNCNTWIDEKQVLKNGKYII